MNAWDVQRWNAEYKGCLFSWRSYNLKSIKGIIRSQTLIKSEGEDSENMLHSLLLGNVIHVTGFSQYIIFAFFIWTTFILSLAK